MARNSKITVSKIRTRVGPRWAVRHRDPVLNKIKRPCFILRSDAEDFKAALENQNRDAIGAFSVLPPGDQAHLLEVWREARRRGVDLMAAVFQASGEAKTQPGLGKVIGELIVAKRNAGLSKLYLAGLEGILNRFAKGRESLPVDKPEVVMVEAFLDSGPVEGRATRRARLSALFNFAVRRKYRPDNPCAQLETIKVLKKPVVIFSPLQAETAIKFFLANPFDPSCPQKYRSRPGDPHPGLAWFILTTFAMLRPEEAMKVTRDLLHLAKKKPFIEITPEITKVGMQRIVYLSPGVADALKWAVAHRSRLPLGLQRKRLLLKKLRAHLGWARWPKDVTRKTGISYGLAISKDAKNLAEMAGHTEAVQRKHYKKPVEQRLARKFFAALNLIK